MYIREKRGSCELVRVDQIKLYLVFAPGAFKDYLTQGKGLTVLFLERFHVDLLHECSATKDTEQGAIDHRFGGDLWGCSKEFTTVARWFQNGLFHDLTYDFRQNVWGRLSNGLLLRSKLSKLNRF